MKFLIKEKLSKHKYKDNNGYLICTDCILSRTGKQTYRRDEVFHDGDESEINVDRLEDEVFSPQALASFENKPLVIEHPDVDVNPDNHNELSVGFARNIRKGEYDGEPVMIGDLVITDAEAIDLIESGEMTDLSCGYDCDIEDDENPQQRNIRGNHIALCKEGRAGIAHIVDSVKDKDVKHIYEDDKSDLYIEYYAGNYYVASNDDADNHFFKTKEQAINYLKNNRKDLVEKLWGNFKDSVKDSRETYNILEEMNEKFDFPLSVYERSGGREWQLVFDRGYDEKQAKAMIDYLRKKGIVVTTANKWDGIWVNDNIKDSVKDSEYSNLLATINNAIHSKDLQWVLNMLDIDASRGDISTSEYRKLEKLVREKAKKLGVENKLEFNDSVKDDNYFQQQVIKEAYPYKIKVRAEFDDPDEGSYTIFTGETEEDTRKAFEYLKSQRYKVRYSGSGKNFRVYDSVKDDEDGDDKTIVRGLDSIKDSTFKLRIIYNDKHEEHKVFNSFFKLYEYFETLNPNRYIRTEVYKNGEHIGANPTDIYNKGTWKDSIKDVSGTHLIEYKDIDGMLQKKIVTGDSSRVDEKVKELKSHDCEIIKIHYFINWKDSIKDGYTITNFNEKDEKIILNYFEGNNLASDYDYDSRGNIMIPTLSNDDIQKLKKLVPGLRFIRTSDSIKDSYVDLDNSGFSSMDNKKSAFTNAKELAEEYSLTVGKIHNGFRFFGPKSKLQSMLNDLGEDGNITDSIDDKLVEAPEYVLLELEKELMKWGYKIVSKGKGMLGRIHYQVISKEGNKTKEDMNFFAKNLHTLDEWMYKKHNTPMTFNIGLQKDGYISAGIDVDEQSIEDSMRDSKLRVGTIVWNKKEYYKGIITKIDGDIIKMDILSMSTTSPLYGDYLNGDSILARRHELELVKDSTIDSVDNFNELKNRISKINSRNGRRDILKDIESHHDEGLLSNIEYKDLLEMIDNRTTDSSKFMKIYSIAKKVSVLGDSKKVKRK